MVSLPMFGYVNHILTYNIWNNDFDIIREGRFIDLFKSQLKEENIQLGNLCIFDCTNEGIGTDVMDDIVQSMNEEFPNTEIRVLFNVVVDRELTYRYKSFPQHMVAHCRFLYHVNTLPIDWKEIKIKKHFLSLQRRASVSRIKFTKKLLDNFDSSQYVLSCATQPNRWVNELPIYKEIIKPHRLPILVDGEIDDDRSQHFHTDESFFSCMFNVITETSSQTDDDSWTEIFITEKTFKAFAYRQLPIWNGVKGIVQSVRDLGFDVFDDVINHSYDLIEDEEERQIQVVNELKRLCNLYPTESLDNFRRLMWSRISKNMSLLTEIERLHREDKHNLILKLIQ